MKFRWIESLGLVRVCLLAAGAAGQSRGGDLYAPLRRYQFTVKDQIRFELQSSEDGSAWKMQLAGGQNV
jgi:hypothetical protein